MTALVITTSASPLMTSRPSWRLTLGTWAVLDVAAEDPVEEEEEPVEADLPDHLVSADLIRWAESSFDGEFLILGSGGEKLCETGTEALK